MLIIVIVISIVIGSFLFFSLKRNTVKSNLYKLVEISELSENLKFQWNEKIKICQNKRINSLKENFLEFVNQYNEKIKLGLTPQQLEKPVIERYKIGETLDYILKIEGQPITHKKQILKTKTKLILTYQSQPFLNESIGNSILTFDR